MKSYFLAGFDDEAAANDALLLVFGGQGQLPTKVLYIAGKPAAYFYVAATDDPDMLEGVAYRAPIIQVDIGGSHYNEDQAVIQALTRLQDLVGGSIFDDNGVKVG